MPRYWVMRVDHRDAKDFLWQELTAGRLRQGWGYQADQDLEVIARKKAAGAQVNDHQHATWRGNRRMLPSEPDSIQRGDIILVPHLPTDRHWSIARVVGSYRFDIPGDPKDYGHVLPVELLSNEHPVAFQAHDVAAGLRETMHNLSRLWNIDHLGDHVDSILRSLSERGRILEDPGLDRLETILGALERHGWTQFRFHFMGAEFEKPCVRLLEALYGEGNVEHTGGSSEKGADALCTHRDPLGVPHLVAVQIKMWTWDASWTRPLEQIKQAVDAYPGITAGVILSTSERVTAEFEAARQRLEQELGIPIRVVLRTALLRLFLQHLPKLVGSEEDAPALVSGADFANLLLQSHVGGPTESTDVTNLAWELGCRAGLKLDRVYELPALADGARKVVFMTRKAMTAAERATLMAQLGARTAGMKVTIEPHPEIELDLGDESASAFCAVAARFDQAVDARDAAGEMHARTPTVEDTVKRPPDELAGQQPLDTEFGYEGNVFVRRRGGVNLVIKPPTHAPADDWDDVQALALSFDGYERWGSLERCAEVARGVQEQYEKTKKVGGSVEELRTALFFVQRSYHHMGWPPAEDEMGYIHALVEGLRRRMGDDWIREQMQRARGGQPPNG